MRWNTKSARLAVLLTALLWSSGGLAVKITDCPPIPLTGLRCFFTLVLFFALFRKELSFRFNKAQWAGAIAYCSMAVCYTVATKWTTAANAILLQYTAPIFVALLSSWLLKEKLNKADWLVVLVIMGGMVLFFFDKTDAGGMYFGMVYGGVAYILYSMAIKYVSALTAILIATIEPILNPVWVFLAIGEIPSMYAVAGGSVVVATLLIKNIYDLKKGSGDN